MGTERDAKYYDAFMRNAEYRQHYSTCWYFYMWKIVLRQIKKDARILEVGCGTGQFAEMLFDSGFDKKKYHGFDFSSAGIEWCMRLGDMFSVGNALDAKQYDHDYDTVVCLEVLEHINQDIELLQNIKIGTTMIVSVPESDDPSHVRAFLTEESVRERYSNSIDIQKVQWYGHRHIFTGIKK